MSNQCVSREVLNAVEEFLVDTCHPSGATYAGDVTQTIKQVRLVLKEDGLINEKFNDDMERWLKAARELDEKELDICKKMWNLQVCHDEGWGLDE